MRVDPGEFDTHIEIIKREISADSDGYESDKEPGVFSCWARVDRSSGREILQNGGDFGEETIRVLKRKTPQKVDRKMLIRIDGNDYKITYVRPMGLHKAYEEILAERVTTEAQ